MFLALAAWLAASLSAPSSCSAAANNGDGGSGGGYEAESITYFTRNGISNDFVKSRIDGFIKAEKRDSLWTILREHWCFDGSMQTTTGNQMRGLKGVVTGHLTNSPTRGGLGVLLNGTSQYFTAVGSDMSVSTVFVELQPNTNQAAQAALAQITSESGSHQQYLGGISGPAEWAGPYSHGDGGGDTFTANLMTQNNFPARNAGMNMQDPRRKIVAMANDNAGNIRLWSMGVTNGVHTTARTAPVNQTRIIVGANWGGGTPTSFFRGSLYNVSIFSRVLTDAEVANHTENLRWLNPKLENEVYLGDSIFSMDGAGTWTLYDNIPARLMRDAARSNSVEIYNNGRFGERQGNAIFLYTNFVRPYAPNKNGVMSTDVRLPLGYNDIDGDARQASAIVSDLLTLASMARADKCRVTAFTPYYAVKQYGGAGVAFPTNYAELGGQILANRGAFDQIVRLDMMMAVTNGVEWVGDSVHPSATGMDAIAQYIANGGKDRFIGTSYFATGSMTNGGAGTATDCFHNLMPSNELLKPGDSVTYSYGGGYTNNATPAKRAEFYYGSEQVLDSVSRVAHIGPWRAVTKITMVSTNNSQFVETEYFGTSTNFTWSGFTSQTNRLPTFLRVRLTADQPGYVTNTYFGKVWAPRK